MPVKVACACGKAFEAADQFIGKLVRCPGCGLPVEVVQAKAPPKPPPLPVPPKPAPKIIAPAVTEPVEVACACGRSFKAGAALIGKRVRCPGCGLPVEVVGPEIIPEVEDVEIVETDEGPPEVVAPEDEEAEAGGSYGFKEEELPLAPVLGDAVALKGSLGEVPLGQPAQALALSAGSKWGLAAQGQAIHILDMKNFKKLFRFREHEDAVTALAISPDARFALSGDDRGHLCYWEIDRGKLIEMWRGHRSGILAAAFSPDGKRAVTGGHNGHLKLWQLPKGDVMELNGGTSDPAVLAVAFSGDGKQILTGGEEGRVALWNAQTGKRLHKLKGADEDIETVAFAEGGMLAVAGALSRSSPGVVGYHWTTHNGKRVPTFSRPSERMSDPSCVILPPSGQRLLVGSHKFMEITTGDDLDEWVERVECYCLEFWTIESGRQLQAYNDVGAEIVRLAVSPDSGRALASLKAGWLSLWGLPY